MNENQKFEQIWGFRRNSDSSSDDSKSNSDLMKGQENLRLVPNLVSPENDRVSETNDRQVEVEKKPKRARNGPKKEKNNKKAEKAEAVKSKPKKDSCASSNIKKVSNDNSRKKKKSKFISQMTVSDDFRIFTESILDDLQVARETMFAKMRKEMDQLVNLKPPSKSTKKKISESNPAKKTNQKPRARKPTKPKQKNKLSTCKGLDHPQEQVNNENANDPSSKNSILNDSSAKNSILIDSSAKNPILIDSSPKKPIMIDSSPKIPMFTNTPDQLVTSSYLTLPSVLPNSRSNDTSLTLERNNYSGLQRFGHNSTESSCVGNGYPVGLNHHQRFDNSNNFGIPNRVVQGFSHDGNLFGIRMMNGGGIRYNAGLTGHKLPNHLGSNGFRSLYPNK